MEKAWKRGTELGILAIGEVSKAVGLRFAGGITGVSFNYTLRSIYIGYTHSFVGIKCYIIKNIKDTWLATYTCKQL